MDTRPLPRGAPSWLQASPQHPQIIVTQRVNPGMKKTAALRSAHSAAETCLSEPCSLRGFSLQAVGLGDQGLAQDSCAGDEGLTPEGLGDPLRLDMAGLSFVRHTAGVGVAPHQSPKPELY